MEPASNVKPSASETVATADSMLQKQPVEQTAFEQHLSEAQQREPPQTDPAPSRRGVAPGVAEHIVAAEAQSPRLVVVSNRLSKPGGAMTGGLAAALLPAVERSGALWVGASGPLKAGNHELGEGALVKLDLPAADYDGYYNGFSNSTLWPALHSLRERISFSEDDYKSYRKMNAFMADALLDYKERDAFWVHDYHWLTLGAELRDRRVDRPIGFFLHTPWPAPGVMQLVRPHRELIEAMLAYDLAGFQTDEDRQNFLACVRAELGLAPSEDGVVISPRGITRCQVFPIGIDTDKFARYAKDASSNPDVSKLLDGLNREKLAVGVDRLDYTKGIDNRIQAVGRALDKKPKSIALLQVATSSRDGIPSYRDYQNDVKAVVDDVNARHGADDWMPIRYETEPVSQAVLAGLYRAARVGVVTPLRDGMNLVAKEYVAAQDPISPGVLVLSKYAGAAKELDAALLVDPNDIEGMAETIAKAIEMPPERRLDSYRKMIKKLQDYPIGAWWADFVAKLEDSRIGVAAGDSIPLDAGASSRSESRTIHDDPAGPSGAIDHSERVSYPDVAVPATVPADHFGHIGFR